MTNNLLAYTNKFTNIQCTEIAHAELLHFLAPAHDALEAMPRRHLLRRLRDELGRAQVARHDRQRAGDVLAFGDRTTGGEGRPMHPDTFLMDSYNFLTPVDESTTHYFWFQTRNVMADDGDVSVRFAESVRPAGARAAR